MAPKRHPALEAQEQMLTDSLSGLEDAAVHHGGNTGGESARVRRLRLDALADEHLQPRRCSSASPSGTRRTVEALKRDRQFDERGSNASRKSPSRLNERVRRSTASPGQTMSSGWVAQYSVADERRLPQLADGSLIPRLRKEKLASRIT